MSTAFFGMESECGKRAPVVETDTFSSFLSFVIILKKIDDAIANDRGCVVY